MTSKKTTFTRRKFLSSVGIGASVGLTSSLAKALALPKPPANITPAKLAQDADFWASVASHYDRTDGIINLEHGYWGKMAHPVQHAYLEATRMVNKQNSFYARKRFNSDEKISTRRVAQALGVHEDEIVLTRNATEAIHNLIRQYNDLEDGDAVLYADVDYPYFKTTMQWLQDSRNAQAIQLILPTRATQDQIFELYRDAFDANPNLKLMLIMHVSNQHGLVIPVSRIADEARKRGIDIICDAAQSWGLLDYQLPSLNIDWAGFNLHKWIGSPVGVGALYMRRGSLTKIDPYPGQSDPENNLIKERIHSGTGNFASILAIPDALNFHQSIGGANKEARLRYLRGLWTDEAETMPHIELLGGLDESSWTGMGSFRLKGKRSEKDAKDLQLKLEREFGIFTVVRDGLASGHCVRITPQVFSTPKEMTLLVQALHKLA